MITKESFILIFLAGYVGLGLVISGLFAFKKTRKFARGFFFFLILIEFINAVNGIWGTEARFAKNYDIPYFWAISIGFKLLYFMFGLFLFKKIRGENLQYTREIVENIESSYDWMRLFWAIFFLGIFQIFSITFLFEKFGMNAKSFTIAHATQISFILYGYFFQMSQFWIVGNRQLKLDKNHSEISNLIESVKQTKSRSQAKIAKTKKISKNNSKKIEKK